MTLAALAVRRLKILRLGELTGSVPLTGLRQAISVIVMALLRARRGVEAWERDTGVSGRRGLAKGEGTVGHDSSPTEHLRLRADASHIILVFHGFPMVSLDHRGHGTI